MIGNEGIQAGILDRLLQRMLEGKNASGDSARDAGAAAEIRPLMDTAESVRRLLSGQGPSPEFIAESENRLLWRRLEGEIAAGDPAGDAGAGAEIRPLMDTAESVRRLLSGHGPSPEFITASENRLLWRIKPRTSATARRASPAAGFFQRGWLRTAAAMAVVVAVMSVSGWGVASASAGTLPGDRLYPVKRGLEEVSLAVSMSAAGDVALLADYADARVYEIQQLAAMEREVDILAALENYDKALFRLDAAMDQLPSGTESARLAEIQIRLARHAEALLALRDRLPEQAQPALTQAVEHAQNSNVRVEELKNERNPELISTKLLSPEGPDTEATPQQPTGPTQPTDTLEPTKPSKTSKPEKTDKPTDIPEPTKTSKPEKTDNPTDVPEPTKTSKPEKTDKPTDVPEPSKPPKPEKTDKTNVVPNPSDTPNTSNIG
jgi:hypothetical protein